MLPKTLSETHNIILNTSNYILMNNLGEHFLFINSVETNIIGFSCDSNNLEVFLRKIKIMFIDGTFKSSRKLFYQLFQFMDVKNNFYAPLVFFFTSK